MSALTLTLRILGLLLVAASFFMGRIMMVFPGLPLQIGPIPFKHLVFGVGVVLYLAVAAKARLDWKKRDKSKESEL